MAPIGQYKTDRDFSCGICCEDELQGAPYVDVGGDPICKKCYLADIKPQFMAAVNNENDYPVTWGPTVLDPDGFPAVNATFRAKWQAKVKEYGTPRAHRLYCEHQFLIDEEDAKWWVHTPEAVEKARQEGREVRTCGQFLGSAAEISESTIACSLCGGPMCTLCGLSLHIDSQPHDCVPLKERSAIANYGVRGRDFQICPNPACVIPTTLGDGCNTIICRCRTHFCFICGKMAHHDSDHWTGSGCPRWNQPGTARARNDIAHDPLVIPRLYIDLAHEQRREAERQPNARFRQMSLDAAVCFNIAGNAIARRTRAEQNGGLDLEGVEFGDWVNPLLNVLKHVRITLNQRFYYCEGKEPFFDSPEKGVRGFEDRLKLLDEKVAMFSERYLAIFALYPHLRPLIDRARAVCTTEIDVWKGFQRAAEIAALRDWRKGI